MKTLIRHHNRSCVMDVMLDCLEFHLYVFAQYNSTLIAQKLIMPFFDVVLTTRMDGWMDGFRFYVPSNSISVISGR